MINLKIGYNPNILKYLAIEPTEWQKIVIHKFIKLRTMLMALCKKIKQILLNLFANVFDIKSSKKLEIIGYRHKVGLNLKISAKKS